MNNTIKDFIFYQDPDTRWYVDLPEWTGSKADLEMVMGADDMLNYMAEGENKVRLFISESEIEGYDKLTLDIETPELGGGYYLLKTYRGIDLNLRMWLCSVTSYVLGLCQKKYILVNLKSKIKMEINVRIKEKTNSYSCKVKVSKEDVENCTTPESFGELKKEILESIASELDSYINDMIEITNGIEAMDEVRDILNTIKITQDEKVLEEN